MGNGSWRSLHNEEEAVEGGVREVRREEELHGELCEKQHKEVSHSNRSRSSSRVAPPSPKSPVLMVLISVQGAFLDSSTDRRPALSSRMKETAREEPEESSACWPAAAPLVGTHQAD